MKSWVVVRVPYSNVREPVGFSGIATFWKDGFLEWCKENIGDYVYLNAEEGRTWCKFGFATHDDAVLFKMVWG